MIQLALMIAFGVARAACLQPPAPEVREISFEQGDAGTLPRGWVVPTPGWSAELTTEHAAAGSKSLKLHVPDKSGEPFGNVMFSQPVGDNAGRRWTLSARVKVVGEGRAQMWLRVDRPNLKRGAFDNMGDRPITPGDWKSATIEADIDSDATTINFGFMAMGGKPAIYIDDVRIKVSADPRPRQQPSAPKELTARGTQNVVAATKLLAYLRFFHPSDQAVGVKDWDGFAVHLITQAEPAADATDLAKRLKEAVADIAPTIWAGPASQVPPGRPVPTGVSKAALWRHLGAGRVASAAPYQAYQSEVKKASIESLDGGVDAWIVVKELGGGVCGRIPVAVPCDKRGTLPHGKTPAAWITSNETEKLTALNRSTRLAGVALAWGVFQHFYPYFDVVETDWEAALTAALNKAAYDKDELEYLFTLREMVAKLHDGHGNVWNPALQATTFLPVALKWAGKELVVVGKDGSVSDQVQVGDCVVSINGKSAEECHRDACRWISAATEGWQRANSGRVIGTSLRTADPVRIAFIRRSPGKAEVKYEQTLARVKQLPAGTPPKRPTNGEEVAPGIVYFDLNAAETQTLMDAMPKLTAAKAIIFDMRGYPGSAGGVLMNHLLRKRGQSARWCIPIIRKPDRVDWEWNESGRWQLAPTEPHLKARIAFLTGGGAISYAESVMGIVEHYKLGEIIGETTAGTYGNINPFTLPGGYSVSWTGMKVLKHDGSQHHGVGIRPTVSVTPTAAGIAAGGDEVLERAIEVMQEKIVADGGQTRSN